MASFEFRSPYAPGPGLVFPEEPASQVEATLKRVPKLNAGPLPKPVPKFSLWEPSDQDEEHDVQSESSSEATWSSRTLRVRRTPGLPLTPVPTPARRPRSPPAT